MGHDFFQISMWIFKYVALPAVGFVLRCQGALVILETEISGCGSKDATKMGASALLPRGK